MRTVQLLVAAAAMTATMSGAALAQFYVPPELPPEQGVWSGPMPGFGWMPYGGPGPRPAMVHPVSRGSGQTPCSATVAAHIDDKLASIEAELKITEAQAPLWEAYAAAVRDSAKAALARCTALASQRGNAAVSLPDRFGKDEQLLTAQLNAVRAVNAALKPLYAVLSDGQKSSADHLSRSLMGSM